MTQTDNALAPDWEAPKELYFYDDWLRQNTKGRMLCGNHKYIRADLPTTPQDDPRVGALVDAANALREIVPNVMGTLMSQGRAGLLMAHEVHKCDDALRNALAALSPTGGNDE